MKNFVTYAILITHLFSGLCYAEVSNQDENNLSECIKIEEKFDEVRSAHTTNRTELIYEFFTENDGQALSVAKFLCSGFTKQERSGVNALFNSFLGSNEYLNGLNRWDEPDLSVPVFKCEVDQKNRSEVETLIHYAGYSYFQKKENARDGLESVRGYGSVFVVNEVLKEAPFVSFGGNQLAEILDANLATYMSSRGVLDQDYKNLGCAKLRPTQCPPNYYPSRESANGIPTGFCLPSR